MRYLVKMALIAGLLVPVAEGARADSTSDAIHAAVNDRIDIADTPVAIEIVYDDLKALARRSAPSGLRGVWQAPQCPRPSAR